MAPWGVDASLRFSKMPSVVVEEEESAEPSKMIEKASQPQQRIFALAFSMRASFEFRRWHRLSRHTSVSAMASSSRRYPFYTPSSIAAALSTMLAAIVGGFSCHIYYL